MARAAGRRARSRAPRRWQALNVGKEPLVALYRARVLAHHGLDPAAVPKRHQILLVRKEGRRAIANFRQVLRDVRARFGALARVVETSFVGLTVGAQLELVAQTTVAVSPCGGVSMILPFLPAGAHAILMNYMLGSDEPARHGECAGCSWSMEAELWRHVRHVKPMYYQVWGPADFAHGKPGRDVSVKVDSGRLGALIEAALHGMEP